MQNVPKIVRERLRAAMPAVNHPDADVLAAFTERSLPELERAVVVEHLARCTDCREIVALALPSTEAAETVTARARWATWPVLRWGFAAAGVLVVASVGFIQYRRRSQPATMVAQESRSDNNAYVQRPTAPTTAATSAREADKAMEAPKTAGGAPAKKEAAKLPENKLVANAVPPVVHRLQSQTALGGPVDALRGYGPKMPTQWQQAQPSATEERNFKAAAAAPSTAGKQRSAHAYEMKVPPGSQSVEAMAGVSQLEASPMETPGARQEVPSQPSEQIFDAAPGPVKAKPAMTNVIPSWAISSAGRLERSFDQGKTWQDVDVNADALKGLGASSLALVTNTARTKDLEAEKKTSVAPVSAPVFRAVAANGVDVWAGGSNGALYHSLDAGNHWLPVAPLAGGVILTGDVVRLEFSDPQHGRILTSSGEVWMTGDDGQTWQKQ